MGLGGCGRGVYMRLHRGHKIIGPPCGQGVSKKNLGGLCLPFGGGLGRNQAASHYKKSAPQAGVFLKNRVCER